MFSVLDDDFSQEQDDFRTEEEAVRFILDMLPHEDHIYVVVQDGRVVCFVYGGETYRNVA